MLWVQSMVGIMAFNQPKFLALKGKLFFNFQVLWHEHGLHVRSSFENFALQTLHLGYLDPKEIEIVVNKLNMKFGKKWQKIQSSLERKHQQVERSA